MTQTKKTDDIRMNLASHDAVADRLEGLKDLFPEAFVEGKVDLERLRQHLGDFSHTGTERYGLTWAGKAEAIRALQIPSHGTLVPMRKESVNFDESENMIIEGDNLEVLKLLQKSYHGKIKMIYIDPPYNTGGDFIYPDNFKEGLDTYLKYSGQATEEGFKATTNAESGGRYHSNWLNMMYPRLFMAKSLLQDDGVIFVSIDDNEANNLKAIMDEIFGEENHLVTFYVQVRYPGKTLAEKNHYQKLIEQVLVYRRYDYIPIKETEDYTTEKFVWKILEKNSGKRVKLGTREAIVFGPDDYEILKCKTGEVGLKETWATGTVLKANASGKFFKDFIAPRKETDGLGFLYKVFGIGEDGLGYRYFTGPRKATASKGKFYSGIPLTRQKELENGDAKKEKPILNYYDFADGFGNCRHEGLVDFRGGKKPIKFLKEFIKQSTVPNEEAIILDFFAGSGSLGHAVLDQNKEDGGNRKFILVQLPETTKTLKSDGSYEENEVSKQGYKTILDICIKRIKNCIKEYDLFKGDGFKVFGLRTSNFKLWGVVDALKDTETLAQTLELFADNVLPDRSQEDILYEVILKSGQPLTAKIEKIKVAGQQVFSINDGAMLVCLEDPIEEATLRGMLELTPAVMVALDKAFHGNDQLKTNIKLQAEATGESEQSRVLFKTV